MAAKPERRRRKERKEKLQPGTYCGARESERAPIVIILVDGPLAIYERGRGRQVALVSALQQDLRAGGFTRRKP